MDDDISRKKVLALIRTSMPEETSSWLLYQSIEQMPSEQKVGKWISCKERLPKEEKNVLVTVFFKGLELKHAPGWNEHIKPHYYVDIANQINGEWNSYSDDYKIAKSQHEIIAWCELPEPCMEEEDENIGR